MPPLRWGFIFMELTEYPAAIAAAQIKVLDLGDQLGEAEMDLARVNARFDLEIAHDPELKNDTQRRASRLAVVLQDGEHVELTRKVVVLGQRRAVAIVERDQRQDEFRVAKLLIQREIAQTSATIAAL